MSRMVASLAVVLVGPAAFLLASTADASPAPVLAAVAVATVVALIGLTCVVATAAPTALALRSSTPDEPIPFLAARVTDPLHHPLRPRAPGLA